MMVQLQLYISIVSKLLLIYTSTFAQASSVVEGQGKMNKMKVIERNSMFCICTLGGEAPSIFNS